MTVPHRIEKLFAWIVTDFAGEDCIPTIACPIGGRPHLLPLVGSDMARMEAFREHAQASARHFGTPARLVLFGGATVLDTIEP